MESTLRHMIFGIGCVLIYMTAQTVAIAEPPEIPKYVEVCGGSKMKLLHVIPHLMPVGQFEEIVEDAKSHGFCGVVIGIRSGLELNSLKVLSHVPVLDRDFFMVAKSLGEKHGIAMIPEFKFLTHQEHFLKFTIPNGLYNLTTYDPNSKPVRSVIERVLEEIIAILDPPAVHIGHDEVAGITRYSQRHFMRDDDEILPASLFLNSVIHLHSFLSSKNVQTWMWADMLIESPEAPEMMPAYFHGDLEGYGTSLRQKIPKDIVLFDWHYRDQGPIYSSISLIKRSGFEVVGVVHNNYENIMRFSNQAFDQGAGGMMLTTWDAILDKDYDEIGSLLRATDKAFARFK